MILRIVRRLLLFPILLISVNAFSFLIITSLALREEYLFGPPPAKDIFAAYPPYLAEVFKGNLGVLPATNTPVGQFILETLPNSLILLGMALLVAAITGVAAGFLSI